MNGKKTKIFNAILNIIANIYYKLGLYNDLASIQDSAYLFYNESKKVYEALKDSGNVGLRLRNMAILSSDKCNSV